MDPHWRMDLQELIGTKLKKKFLQLCFSALTTGYTGSVFVITNNCN